MPQFNDILSFLNEQQVMQPDMVTILEEERKRRKKEEEERAAFVEQLLQAQKQKEQPEMEQPQILSRLLDERFSPEREARLKAMRSETPEMIQQRLYSNYWGAPTSKLGKVGTTILQIASGMLGAPTPDFRGEAMKEWLAKQKVAGEEEGSEMKLAAAEAQGIARQNAASKNAAAMAERERLKATVGMFNQQIAQDRLGIEQQKADAIKAGMDAKVAEQQFNQKLQEMMLERSGGLSVALKGAKTDAERVAIAEMMMNTAKTPEEKKLAADFGRTVAEINQAEITAKKAQAATPDRTVPSPRVALKTDLAGNAYPLDYMGQRVIPGKVGNNLDPNALGAAVAQRFGGLTSAAQPQQAAPQQQVPQVPQMPQSPMMQQPRPTQQPLVPPQPKPHASKRLRDEFPEAPTWAYEVNPPVQTLSGKEVSRTPQIRSAFYTAAPSVGQPLGNKDVIKEDEGFSAKMREAANMNGTVQKAFLDGSLDKISGTGRSVAAALGGDKLFSSWYKIAGSPEEATLEGTLQRLSTEQIANYLKAMSGAQVSHQEYDRLKDIFPTAGAPAEQTMLRAWWNVTTAAVLHSLETQGILTAKNSAQIGDAVSKVLSTSMLPNYLNALKDIKAKGNTTEARSKYDLDAFTDINAIAADVLRAAYPGAAGETIKIPHNDRRFGIGTAVVKVPQPTAGMQKDNEDARKRERERLEREAADIIRKKRATIR